MAGHNADKSFKIAQDGGGHGFEVSSRDISTKRHENDNKVVLDNQFKELIIAH